MAEQPIVQIVNFLKTVSTSTQGLEFLSDDMPENLPPGVDEHIAELEDLISRLSLEAEAMLGRLAMAMQNNSNRGRGNERT